MEELGITCAAIISFAQKIEGETAEFYEHLAERYTESKADFLSFSKKSKKNEVLITRTYQETISDALEACFIEGLNLNNMVVARTLPKDVDFAQALRMAIRLEDEATKFHSEIAERTKSLLATIPMVFKKVAKNRRNQKLKLESILRNLN